LIEFKQLNENRNDLQRLVTSECEDRKLTELIDQYQAANQLHGDNMHILMSFMINHGANIEDICKEFDFDPDDLP
jgi:hypothetical protein